MLNDIARLSPVLLLLIAFVVGVLFERFARTLPSAVRTSRIGILLLLLGMIFPYLFLLLIEFDTYLFSVSGLGPALPQANALPVNVDGFGMVACLVAGLIGVLLLWDMKRSARSRWSVEPVRMAVGVFGVMLGFLHVVGTGNLLVLWGGVEVLLFSAQRMLGRNIRPRRQNNFGGFYAGLTLFGIVMFFGMFGTTAIADIYSALSTPNIEIVQVNLLLIGMLLLIAGFLTRIGSGVASLLRADSEQLPRSNGLLSLIVLWTGAVITVRLFMELFPTYLFGFNLANIPLSVGGVVGIVSALLAIGSNDRVKVLCYGMAGHIGIAILGFASENTGIFGPRSWLTVNMLLSIGLLIQITRLSGGSIRYWGKKRGGDSVIRATFGARLGLLWTSFLFLALAGAPFTGGFLARIVMVGSTTPVPFALPQLTGQSLPRRYYLYDPEIPDSLGWPFIVAGLVLAVLLLYAYGRLFKRLYFASEDEETAAP